MSAIYYTKFRIGDVAVAEVEDVVFAQGIVRAIVITPMLISYQIDGEDRYIAEDSLRYRTLATRLDY